MTKKSPPLKESPFLNLLFNLIIPFVIMTRFSKPQYLGQVYGLITALIFPFFYGAYDLIRAQKVNYFSLIGLISILLTGGIGLMELDKSWMVVKETSIPAIMGLIIFITEKTSRPLVKVLLGQIIDLDKIMETYKEKNRPDDFLPRLRKSSYMLGITFFISAALNFALALVVLKGKPGTSEFVESIGRMTFYSFPVISLPMTVMTGLILWYLFRAIKEEVGLEMEDVLKNSFEEK